MKTEKVLTPNIYKSILILCLNLAFVVLGVYNIILGNSLAGWFSILFFGVTFIIAIVQLLPNATYLKLTPKGFEMCSLYRKTFVPWTMVSTFSHKRVFLNNMVMINFEPSVSKTLQTNSKKRVANRGALPSTYGLSAKKLVLLLNNWKQKNT